MGGAAYCSLPGFEGRRTDFGNYSFWKPVKVDLLIISV